MNKINTICHLADIHIRKSPTRNIEYSEVFENLYAKLRILKPDRILIAGDLVHDNLDLQGEQLILASSLLNNLAKIAPVRITRGNHDCFTPEHEVLTRNGWVKFDEYKKSEVLTFNPNNKSYEFQLPTDIIIKPFSGIMKQIVTDKCDFIVTPNHEILLKKLKNGEYYKIKANDLNINECGNIPISSCENIKNNDLWFELLGFCLADATFLIKNKNTMNGRVQFHFKKERKIEYLINLLTNLNIKHTVRIGDKNRNTKVICIYSQLARDIMKFFSYKKEISWNIIENDKYKLKSFIDGYLNGDGCNIDYDRYSCTTIFKTNAEILSTISNYIGYYSHINENIIFGNYENSKQQYIFYINKKNDKSSKIIEINDHQYDGNVYCLSVPNENLLIRHNGRILITGNCRKSALSRVDSIEAITTSIANPNILFYNETNFYNDENVTWAVWNHGDKDINPWKKNKKHKVDTNQTYVDLYHDPINGCTSATGFEMKSKGLVKLSDFNGKYLMAGDIHKQQYLDKDKRKAYPSSLIAQDFGEGDDSFHGFLLWDISKDTVEEIAVENSHSFKNINITPYIDFDDLDFEIDNPTDIMNIRFVWSTLPQTKSKGNIDKIVSYVKNKYPNIKTIAHKKNFIDNTKMDNVEDKKILSNITNVAIQQQIFIEYLTKIGCDGDVIDDVLKLDDEITKKLDNKDIGTGEWSIIKFGGVNFMSYGDIDIDWRNENGLFQITGKNTAGKTTIIKIISYVLYGETLETENRIKFGDSRFVNNRNDATYCEGYCVIESNNSFYGIKRRTDIKKSKDGIINGSPTQLKYYLLKTPDDLLDDTNLIDNLTDDQKVKTQKVIEQVIGSYDNFKRIISTTSDTLNKVLSNDMAEFIDSLLYDSGLDIFDRKLTAFKDYEKNKGAKIRVNCDVEKTKLLINGIKESNAKLSDAIIEHEKVLILDKEGRITKGWEYIETLNKKLYNIDDEIYNLDIETTNKTILVHKKNIDDIVVKETTLINLITPLCSEYDESRLKELLEAKENHKTNEYASKMKIKDIKSAIQTESHSIELINGEILRLKEQGLAKKNEIIKLRESKTCPTCNQELKPEHLTHIEASIKVIEKDMFGIADKIREKQNIDIPKHDLIIEEQNKLIELLNKSISSESINMESVLAEIGVLTNQKNDVSKRNEYQLELNNIPTKIQNEELNIGILEQKLNNHKNSLLQIEENKKKEDVITQAKDKIKSLGEELTDLKENVFIYKSNIANNEASIKTNNDLITAYIEQEHNDNVNNLYKTCVHRNGIPTQMLVEYVIPKINTTMESILSHSEFNIWLDSNDLRPKLVYHNRPTSIIDCIGASGKERTFSSIILKFSLNQINVKSKPTIFLLDEVMGKLTDESIGEFIEVLNVIKENSNKVIIIEHDKNVNPDYLLNVIADENGISSVTLN